MPRGPSTLHYFENIGSGYQLVERAKILRVLFESENFDRARSPQTAAATLTAAAVRQLFAPFIGSIPGVAGGIDPLVGVPAPPPQYKLIVSTEISERQIEVPYISLTPGIQYVPREGDYVLVFFLGDHQGVAFGHWEQVGPDRSYRQGRLPLQRGDLALMPFNVLRPNATHLIMTSGGVVRLASTDSCYVRMDPFDSRITMVMRNFLMHSGVHRLQIVQGRNVTRDGRLDLEVYESSIARSNTAQQTVGRVVDTLRGGISLFRMGRSGFSKGVRLPPSPISPDFDMWFAGVEEDLAGQKDPEIRATRRLKSFFSMSRLGEVEINAGDYQPAEVPEPPAGQIPTPLPPETPPTTFADLKVRSSQNILVDAILDLIQRVGGKIDQVSFGEQRFKGLSFKFQAGPTPSGLGGIEISEDGTVLLYLGPDPELATTKIELNVETQTITIKSPLLVVVDAPILQLGLLVPTIVRAGAAGGHIVYDPAGGITINALGLGNVSINALGAGKIFLGGAGKAVMLDSIIQKFNDHSHGGVMAGGDTTGNPASGTTDESFDNSDKSAQAESID